MLPQHRCNLLARRSGHHNLERQLGSLSPVSILSIRTIPDPVLRSPVDEVSAARFGTPGLARLIASMHETMDAVQGVGLAGPQVGVSQAIFVFNLNGRRGHVINPTLTTWGEPLSEPKEGCLSVPEIYFAPARTQHAKVTGSTMDGEPVSYQGEGLFARMLQHEVDHLYGYLFVDRLEGDDARAARRAMASKDFAQATRRVQSQRATDISSSFGSGAAFRTP